jgi:hypothetical protein
MTNKREQKMNVFKEYERENIVLIDEPEESQDNVAIVCFRWICSLNFQSPHTLNTHTLNTHLSHTFFYYIQLVTHQRFIFQLFDIDLKIQIIILFVS